VHPLPRWRRVRQLLWRPRRRHHVVSAAGGQDLAWFSRWNGDLPVHCVSHDVFE